MAISEKKKTVIVVGKSLKHLINRQPLMIEQVQGLEA